MRPIAAATLMLLSNAALAQGILRIPVVDKDGNPAAGARVQVLHWADIDLSGPHETLVRASADADEKGRVRLRLLEGREHVCLLAYRGDQAVFACDTPVADIRKDGFRLRLLPARAIEGRLAAVVDGARVRLIFPGREEMHGLDATVAEDGSFAFAPLPDAILREGVRIQAAAPGHARVDRRLSAAEIGGGATVTLRKSRTVSGRVVDAEGSPVADAEVWFGSWMKREKAVSGADGRFALGGVPDVRVTVHVLPPRHALASIPVDPGKRKLGDVAVAEGEPVKGTVAEFDGAEIERAFVALEAENGVRVRTADVGPDGTFELPGIGEGPHELRCWIHAARNIGGTRVIERSRVRAGGEALELVAPEGLCFRLLDRNGRPWPAREVRLTITSPKGKRAVRHVRAQGSAFHEIRFPPSSPGITFDVHLRTGRGAEATLRGIGSDALGRAQRDVVFDADAPLDAGVDADLPPVLPRGELPPAKFGADDDKDDVRAYVREILEAATEDRTSWSTGDPECRRLKMVGKAHVDVLVEALDGDRDNWIHWAIEALADESHKELVLQSLSEHRELAACVVEHRWAKDAEPILVRGVRESPSYLPTAWIDALASIGDRSHDRLLLQYLETGMNPAYTWKAIGGRPGLDAKAAVARMWKRARERDFLRFDAAQVAVEFGHVDALAALVATMQSGREWERRRAAAAVRGWTGRSGSVDEIAAWFRRNRDRLTFDAGTKRYVVAER